MAAVLAGCGGSHHAHRLTHPRARAHASTTPRALLRGGRRGTGLAIGVTEANANLLWSSAARPQTPPGFALGRELLAALHPDYVGLYVDWSALQPTPGRAADLGRVNDGCDRGAPPCASYAGLRDELAAIASQQRAGAAYEPVIAIYGVPSWAAAPPSGCERPGTAPRSRPLAAAAVPAYRALIAQLLDLGRQEGVALRWWSPWNEPNHPFFISPQRARCSSGSPSLAPATYTALAGAMQAELARDSQPHELLLGDLAGLVRSTSRSTSIAEFVAGLPRSLICDSQAFGLHDYDIAAPRQAAAALERALDARGTCGRRLHIWITETGARVPGASRAPRALQGCRQLASALEIWNTDPRVDAAFQYAFREDPNGGYGLIDPGLTTPFPSYAVWRAWGERPPNAPAPSAGC